MSKKNDIIEAAVKEIAEIGAVSRKSKAAVHKFVAMDKFLLSVDMEPDECAIAVDCDMDGVGVRRFESKGGFGKSSKCGDIAKWLMQVLKYGGKIEQYEWDDADSFPSLKWYKFCAKIDRALMDFCVEHKGCKYYLEPNEICKWDDRYGDWAMDITYVGENEESDEILDGCEFYVFPGAEKDVMDMVYDMCDNAESKYNEIMNKE